MLLKRMTCGLILSAIAAAGCHASPATQPQESTAPVANAKSAATAPSADGYTHQRAVTLYRAAKYADDEKLCLAAVAGIEKQNGPKSRDLAEPLDDLATIYLRLADFKKAQPVLERAESVLDRTKPEDAILLGRLAIDQGWRLYSLHEIDAAQRVFAEGRMLIEKNQKGDSVELAELLNNLGLTHGDSEDPDQPPSPQNVEEAKTLLFKGWQMRRKLTGDVSAESGESLNNIGMHLLYHGEGDEDADAALSTLKKALEVSEKVYGADHPETAVSHANLATAFKLLDDPDAAREHAAKALAMTEKFLGKDHIDRAYELQILAELDQDDGKYPEAEAGFKEAVRILEKTFGPNHINVASGLVELKDLYQASGEEAKEKAVTDRIEKLMGKEI